MNIDTEAMNSITRGMSNIVGRAWVSNAELAVDASPVFVTLSKTLGTEHATALLHILRVGAIPTYRLSDMVSAGRIQTQLMCAKAKGTQCYQTDFHMLYPAGYETTVYLTSDKIFQVFPLHICPLESMKYWEVAKPWEQG